MLACAWQICRIYIFISRTKKILCNTWRALKGLQLMKAKGALDTLKMIGNGSNPIQGGYKCGESVIIDKLLSLTQLNIFVTLTFVVCL